MRDEHEQRGRVLAVEDRERADRAYPCAIHRGHRGTTDEVDERALLRTRQKVVAPHLDVLARRILSERLELWPSSPVTTLILGGVNDPAHLKALADLTR